MPCTSTEGGGPPVTGPTDDQATKVVCSLSMTPTLSMVHICTCNQEPSTALHLLHLKRRIAQAQHSQLTSLRRSQRKRSSGCTPDPSARTSPLAILADRIIHSGWGGGRRGRRPTDSVQPELAEVAQICRFQSHAHTYAHDYPQKLPSHSYMSGRGRQGGRGAEGVKYTLSSLDSAPQAQEGRTPRPRCSHAIADRAASSPAARPANELVCCIPSSRWLRRISKLPAAREQRTKMVSSCKLV